MICRRAGGRGPGRIGAAFEVDVRAREQLRGGIGRIKAQEARPEVDGLASDEHNGRIGGHGAKTRRTRSTSSARRGGGAAMTQPSDLDAERFTREIGASCAKTPFSSRSCSIARENIHPVQAVHDVEETSQFGRSGRP